MATALEKSHSKSSNAKLTMICLLQALSFAVFFGGLAVALGYDKTIGLVAASAGAIGLALTTALVNVFTRG